MFLRGCAFSRACSSDSLLRCALEDVHYGSQEPEELTRAQLLQPPKPWTDELDDPKVNAPVPDPNPEKPLFWVPKPEVCWDKDPKVGAF